jgi:hypothetical protein
MGAADQTRVTLAKGVQIVKTKLPDLPTLTANICNNPAQAMNLESAS